MFIWYVRHLRATLRHLNRKKPEQREAWLPRLPWCQKRGSPSYRESCSTSCSSILLQCLHQPWFPGNVAWSLSGLHSVTPLTVYIPPCIKSRWRALWQKQVQWETKCFATERFHCANDSWVVCSPLTTTLLATLTQSVNRTDYIIPLWIHLFCNCC